MSAARHSLRILCMCNSGAKSCQLNHCPPLSFSIYTVSPKKRTRILWPITFTNIDQYQCHLTKLFVLHYLTMYHKNYLHSRVPAATVAMATLEIPMKILQNWRFDGKNVNWKRKHLQDMFEMVSFHTDAGFKSVFATHRWPRQWFSARSLTIHQPGAVSARWCRECASAEHSLEDSPKSCNRLNFGRAIRWPDIGRNQVMCGVSQILDGGTCSMGRCAELAQGLVCVSVRVHWLPWQQMELVLCCVKKIYGKLSSSVARTFRSNGIDIGRCLWKLLSIIYVSVFFWDTV